MGPRQQVSMRVCVCMWGVWGLFVCNVLIGLCPSGVLPRVLGQDSAHTERLHAHTHRLQRRIRCITANTQTHTHPKSVHISLCVRVCAGPAKIDLLWSSFSQPKQTIPSESLFRHATNPHTLPCPAPYVCVCLLTQGRNNPQCAAHRANDGRRGVRRPL